MAVPVPTKRFVLLVAAGFLIPLASITKPGLERFLVPYDLALFVVFVVSALLGSKKCPVKVTRTIDTVISVRKENEVKLILESEAPYTIKARVRDEAPETCTVAGNEWNLTLLPRKPMTLSYSIVPLERGSGRFRGTFVRTLAPLGLSMVEHVLDTGQTVAIYPNVQAIREFDLLKQKGRLADAGMRRSKLRGLGTEFESIRDYNDDDFRFVDWNATARRGKLMVRNFEQERNQAVIVCLDLGRHLLAEIDGATKLDHCLDAALMLLHAAEREHDLIGLYAFDDTVRAYVAPKKGRAQIAALLKAAHGLQPEAVQPNYAKALSHLAASWKRRSLIVLFTDAEDEDQARELLQGIGVLRRNHLLFVVRVKDPRLNELESLRVTEPGALHMRASLAIYNSQRAEAARILSGAGVTAIESEPKDLAATLVTAYLRVKERAAL